LSCDKDAIYWDNAVHFDMETRHAVLALVFVVAAVMVVRGVVAVRNGEFGTVGRQAGVGAIVVGFGVALIRHWEHVGR
jgi:hypothetical protein